jgi:hypothetical protein
MVVNGPETTSSKYFPSSRGADIHRWSQGIAGREQDWRRVGVGRGTCMTSPSPREIVRSKLWPIRRFAWRARGELVLADENVAPKSAGAGRSNAKDFFVEVLGFAKKLALMV